MGGALVVSGGGVISHNKYGVINFIICFLFFWGETGGGQPYSPKLFFTQESPTGLFDGGPPNRGKGGGDVD